MREVFALAVILAAAPAAADGMLPGGGTIQFGQVLIHENGNATLAAPSTAEAGAAYFNYAHCVCSQASASFAEGSYGLELSVQDEMTPDHRAIQTWVGAGCDVPATRATQCHRVASATIADLSAIPPEGTTTEVRTYDLMQPVPPQLGCDMQQIASEQWEMVDGNGDGTLDYFAGQQIPTDGLPPPLPTNFAAGGGDGYIRLSWTPPADTSDIAAYQVMCATADAGEPVVDSPPAKRYVTARQLCGVALDVPLVPSPIDTGRSPTSTQPDADETVNLPQGFAQLDPTFLCGDAPDPTATSIDIKKLENGKRYLMQLVVVDHAGNPSATYFYPALTPPGHTDFWNDLHARGSGADGGFCLVVDTYGNDHPITRALRYFRDHTLAPTRGGRFVIATYYAVMALIGPVVAGHSLVPVVIAMLAVIVLAPRRRKLAVLLLVLAPALSSAKPAVAIAPIDGDDDGKIAAIVATDAAAHAKVTPPKQVQKTAATLKIDDYESAKAQKKLRTKLKVDAVIHGSVEREGKRNKLTLTISGRNKKTRTFALLFKSSKSKSFHKELRRELGEKLGDVEGETAEEDDTEAKPEAKPDPKPERHEEARVEKHAEPADEDDQPKHTKKKRHHIVEEDDGPPRHPVTQAAMWADVGPAGLHRTLDYDVSGGTMARPPPVGTASFSGQFEAEVYPLSFDSLKATAAGLGLAGSYGKTVALSILIPGTDVEAPIDEGHYSIGARYRWPIGEHSVAAGLSYWNRHYTADRKAIGMLNLDMPDVDYKAVAPEVVGKYAVTPKIGITAALAVPLVMSTGPITNKANYGSASIIAVDFEGAADIALAPHYGLRFALLFDQVGLSFKAGARGVNEATDRTLGVAATFAVLY